MYKMDTIEITDISNRGELSILNSCINFVNVMASIFNRVHMFNNLLDSNALINYFQKPDTFADGKKFSYVSFDEDMTVDQLHEIISELGYQNLLDEAYSTSCSFLVSKSGGGFSKIEMLMMEVILRKLIDAALIYSRSLYFKTDVIERENENFISHIFHWFTLDTFREWKDFTTVVNSTTVLRFIAHIFSPK